MKETSLEEKELESTAFKKQTRRSFLKAGIVGALGIWGIRSLVHMEEQRGLPWFLRRINDLTDSFWQANFRKNALAPAVSPEGIRLKPNGDYGLENFIDEEKWRLQVYDPGLEEPLSLSLAEIKSLPATSFSFEFKCIEGWSQNISCKGVKLSDFMNTYNVGQSIWDTDQGELKIPYEYAGLKSVNGGYYVSMDAKSLWHPQTVLCYEINGQTLRKENGAPLRMMTAVKYGVKSIKQVGRIDFSPSPLPDYWAENGYQDSLTL